VGFVAAGGAFRERRNLEAIRSRGVEIDGEVRAGALSLSASYAYVDARVRAGGAAATLDGLRPAQTPRHQGSATLAWARDRLRASATARTVAAQFEDDQNVRTLRAATTFDAALAVPIVAGPGDRGAGREPDRRAGGGGHQRRGRDRARHAANPVDRAALRGLSWSRN
jgi:hypothetical protein